MLAVFAQNSIVYLGSDWDAVTIALSKHADTRLLRVSSLEELAELFIADEESQEDSLQNLLNRLENIEIESAEQVLRTIKKTGNRTIAEVKSLGIKSMKAAGDGFIALGDLLRNMSEPETTESEVDK